MDNKRHLADVSQPTLDYKPCSCPFFYFKDIDRAFFFAAGKKQLAVIN